MAIQALQDYITGNISNELYISFINIDDKALSVEVQNGQEKRIFALEHNKHNIDIQEAIDTQERLQESLNSKNIQDFFMFLYLYLDIRQDR